MNAGIEVLFDDRDLRAGEKFADADLLGMPYSAIIGKHTTPDSIEIVRRKDEKRRSSHAKPCSSVRSRKNHEIQELPQTDY